MMDTIEIKQAVLENVCFSLGYEKKYISDLKVSYVKEGHTVLVDFSESANIYDPVYSFRVHYNTPRSYSNLLFNILKNYTDKNDCEKKIELFDNLVIMYKNMLVNYA